MKRAQFAILGFVVALGGGCGDDGGRQRGRVDAGVLAGTHVDLAIRRHPRLAPTKWKTSGGRRLRTVLRGVGLGSRRRHDAPHVQSTAVGAIFTGRAKGDLPREPHPCRISGRQAPLAIASELEPLLIDEDALGAFESSLDPVMNDEEMPEELRQSAQAFNQILEDLSDRRLERTEALRRIQELENRLAEGREADAEAMQESLRELGQELQRAEMTEATPTCAPCNAGSRPSPAAVRSR